MADNGQAIIALDRRRMEAMCQKDIPALNAVLADDLVYTHSSARVDTKQSLMGGAEVEPCLAHDGSCALGAQHGRR